MDSKDLQTTLKDLWEGRKPLATTFWGYYVLVWILIRLFGAMLAGLMYPVSNILALAWSAFMIVPIWRSADKYTGPESFSILAKIFVILLALSVIISLFT